MSFNICQAKGIGQVQMEPDLFPEEIEMTLLEELQPNVASLVHRRGFRILEERRDDAFDNALVVVDCGSFLLRVVRDRGNTAIEFCQKGQQRWHSGEHVLEFVGGSSAADLTGSLEANFGRVTDLMNSDLNQRGYTAFEKRKADENIQRLFPQRPT